MVNIFLLDFFIDKNFKEIQIDNLHLQNVQKIKELNHQMVIT